jgi:hypothetical protein
MSEHEPPLPTFLIVGAQKSATRWLRMNLGEHPEVFTAPTELSFFSSPERFGELGVDWYRRQFDGWSGEPIVGEATPAYMMWRHDPAAVAERIRKTLGRARIVAVLRNPVDRAHSALLHHIDRGRLPSDTELLAYVRSQSPEEDQLCIVSGGWYAASLRPYFERFRRRVCVVLHDDVREQPSAVYRTVLGHVRASTEFVPARLDRVRFSIQQPRDDRPAIAYPAARALTADERRELFEHFRDDVRELERMVRRDLSHWDPDRAVYDA